MTDDNTLTKVLNAHKVVHMLGLSPKPQRDSHQVAKYLISNGYRVIPINPTVDEVLGEKAYPSLAEAQKAEPVRLVDVFRKPDALPAIVDALGPLPDLEAVWLQLDVRNADAETRLAVMDIDLVVDKCIKVEHRRLNA